MSFLGKFQVFHSGALLKSISAHVIKQSVERSVPVVGGCVLQVRHRGRTITRKYRVPHFDRRKLLELAKPIYIEENTSMSEKCKAQRQFMNRKGLSDFEEFQVRECRRLLAASELVAVCQRPSLKVQEIKKLRKILLKAGLNLEARYDNDIILHAISGSKWVNMSPVFVGPNVLITSPEADVKQLVTTLKKTPHLVLLGGAMEGRLLSREGMLRAAELPGIEGLHAALTTSLVAGPARTSRLLDTHQQDLTSSLDRYSREEENQQ